jgi:hypothetical protein
MHVHQPLRLPRPMRPAGSCHHGDAISPPSKPGSRGSSRSGSRSVRASSSGIDVAPQRVAPAELPRAVDRRVLERLQVAAPARRGVDDEAGSCCASRRDRRCRPVRRARGRAPRPRSERRGRRPTSSVCTCRSSVFRGGPRSPSSVLVRHPRIHCSEPACASAPLIRYSVSAALQHCQPRRPVGPEPRVEHAHASARAPPACLQLAGVEVHRRLDDRVRRARASRRRRCAPATPPRASRRAAKASARKVVVLPVALADAESCLRRRQHARAARRRRRATPRSDRASRGRRASTRARCRSPPAAARGGSAAPACASRASGSTRGRLRPAGHGRDDARPPFSSSDASPR